MKRFASLSCAILLTATVAAGQARPAPAPAAAPAPAGANKGGGLQVRVADVVVPDYISDSPAGTAATEANAAPSQLRIVAARNATHNAKLVVGSASTIRGLSVQMSELKSGGGGAGGGAAGPAAQGSAVASGTIPASAVQVRYAVPWGGCDFLRKDSNPIVYVAKSGYLGLLAEAPLKEFAPGKIAVRRGGQDLFDTYAPLVPVWLTVKVPASAAPGTYSGQVTVSAEGEKATTLPLELKVLPWTAPDAANWQTWAEFLQSPDTLAIEYNVEPWSAKHWELISRSFRYLREVGNRIVYIPLICHTNMGHEQSMVRWTKKPDGGYTYDFTILDQYLDAAEKNMGKPQIVVLYVWENYMIRKGELATGAAAAHEQQRIVEQMEKEGGLMGKGPAVSVYDPATKAVTMEYLPHFTDPASKAQWKPLFAELTARLAKRGLGKAAMLGMLNDCWPTKAEVEFFKDLAPDMQWALHAHFGRADAYGIAKVGNRAQVWSLEAPSTKSLLGWKQPSLFTRFVRDPEFAVAPLHCWRFWGEYCIAGNQRGVARLGADYWPVVKDKQGRRKGLVWERYPESSWRNLGIYTSLLGAGAEGPQATPRLELFREGLQECEARIAIEKALTDEAAKGKLGADLVQQCQDALAERLARMMENMANRPGCRPGWAWTLGADWPQRTEKLFTLAGEVQKKLEGK